MGWLWPEESTISFDSGISPPENRQLLRLWHDHEFVTQTEFETPVGGVLGTRRLTLTFVHVPGRSGSLAGASVEWLTPDAAGSPAAARIVSCPAAGTMIAPWGRVNVTIEVPYYDADILSGYSDLIGYTYRRTLTAGGTSVTSAEVRVESYDRPPPQFRVLDACVAYGNEMAAARPVTAVQMAGGKPFARQYIDWAELEAWHLAHGGASPGVDGYDQATAPSLAVCIKVPSGSLVNHPVAWTLAASTTGVPRYDFLNVSSFPFPGANSAIPNMPTAANAWRVDDWFVPAPAFTANRRNQWIQRLSGPLSGTLISGLTGHAVSLGGSWWQIATTGLRPNPAYAGTPGDPATVFTFRPRIGYGGPGQTEGGFPRRESYTSSVATSLGMVRPLIWPSFDLFEITVGPAPVVDLRRRGPGVLRQS